MTLNKKETRLLKSELERALNKADSPILDTRKKTCFYHSSEHAPAAF